MASNEEIELNGDRVPLLLPEDADKLEKGDDARGSAGTKYLYGLAVKRDTTVWNLIAMPLLPFITLTVNFFAMAYMPMLLQSKDYYGIPNSELGKATSIVNVWSQMLPLVATPFLTYVYEMIGRRIPLAYALLTTNLLVFLLPQVAPNFTLLCILRAIIGLNNTLIIGAPLISDYVKQESRGRAVAINTLSIGISQVFSTQVLVPLTLEMSFSQSFATSALMMLVLSIPAIFMIREPAPKKQKPSNAQGLEHIDAQTEQPEET